MGTNFRNKSVLDYWSKAFKEGGDLTDEENNPLLNSSAQDILNCFDTTINSKDWKEQRKLLSFVPVLAKRRLDLFQEKQRDILTFLLHHLSHYSPVTMASIETLKNVMSKFSTLSDKDYRDIIQNVLSNYSITISSLGMKSIEEILLMILDRVSFRKFALLLAVGNRKVNHKKSTELTAKLLDKVVIELGPQNILTDEEDISKVILTSVAQMLSSQSLSARYHARNILGILMVSRTLDEYVKKHLPLDLQILISINVASIKSKGVKSQTMKRK